MQSSESRDESEESGFSSIDRLSSAHEEDEDLAVLSRALRHKCPFICWVVAVFKSKKARAKDPKGVERLLGG